MRPKGYAKAGYMAQRIDLYGQDGRFKRIDPWFFYMALFDDSPRTFVKLGISVIPFCRMDSLQVGCPFPLGLVAIDDVGPRQKAAKLEAVCKRIFKEQHTRGEWYRFEGSDAPEVCKAGIRVAFEEVMGRGPKWRTFNKGKVAEVRKAFAFERTT